MNATIQNKSPELSPDAQFALDYVAAMGQDPSSDEMASVVGMAEHLERVDEGLIVLGRLYKFASDNRMVLEALERGENLKYGHGLIEVGSLEELSRATARVLKGLNTGIVIRAGVWGENTDNVGESIVDLLAPLGSLEKVGEESFPKSSMPKGSSGLHLDNFIYDRQRQTGFRYTLSAAIIKTGRAFFISGVATERSGALDTSPKYEGRTHPYEQAVNRLETDSRISGLYRSAEHGRPNYRTHTEFIAKEGTRDSTRITAVVLNPGDTVLWAQGGPGSEAADWHAIRQIGQEPRTSTSYHFVLQTPKAA